MPKNTIAQQGSEIKLNCMIKGTATNPPRIEWYHYGNRTVDSFNNFFDLRANEYQLMDPDPRISSDSNDTVAKSTITFSSLNISESGLYACQDYNVQDYPKFALADIVMLGQY